LPRCGVAFTAGCWFARCFSQFDAVDGSSIGTSVPAGNMHYAFEQFAAFGQDAKDNRIFAEKKLTMPILALGAEKSFCDQQAAILREVGTNVEGGIITGSGHWIMEQQPAQTVSKVRAFLDGK
jgi:pimeloyl-ACP methyl ester carboxylesterase